MTNDLLSHFVGIADQQRAEWTSLGVERATGHRGPAALLPDVGDGTGIAGIELVGRLLGCLGDIAERVNADFQSIRREARLLTGFAVEIDERPEPPRFTADDRHHQRKPERDRHEQTIGVSRPRPTK